MGTAGVEPAFQFCFPPGTRARSTLVLGRIAEGSQQGSLIITALHTVLCILNTYMYDSEEGTRPASYVALSYSVHCHHVCDNRLPLHWPDVLWLGTKQDSPSASKISARALARQHHILLLSSTCSWSHASCPSTPLTFSLVSDRPRETSTRALCSHTSSQSSLGPGEPVNTTWSRPDGPPYRAQLVGSQG